MNVVFYYPRLLTALLWQPNPTDHATLCHWVYAQIFYLWNKPWHDPSDTLGMECVRLLKQSEEPTDPNRPKARRTAFVARCVYLFVLFIWPTIALALSLRKGRRFFSHWNRLVNTFILYFQRADGYDRENRKTMSGLSLYVVLLYIYAKTGWRLPDQKDEIFERCQTYNLPTPYVYTKSDLPLKPGRFFVKPVNGFCARGIFVTSDPAPYAVDPKWVVQDVLKNVPELRRFWGNETLGCLRFATLLTANHEYELAGCELHLPVGDNLVDNIYRGNAYAIVNQDGRLGQLFWNGGPKEGCPTHPTTGLTIEGQRVPRFDECLALALLAHRRIAPNAPFFNADIALTEKGPMLIELNSAVGFPAQFFAEGSADRFIDALCRAIARASRATPTEAGAWQVGTA